MSVDPSAIPNFGGQPEKPENKTPGQGGARKPAGPIMPNQDLIKQLLERMKLKYVTDKEGDLVAPWEKFRTYFMFRGEKQQRILSVRTFYDRPHTIEEKGRLLETIDEWNRRTLCRRSTPTPMTTERSVSSVRRRCSSVSAWPRTTS